MDTAFGYDLERDPGLGAYYAGQMRREQREKTLADLATMEQQMNERKQRLGMDVDMQPYRILQAGANVDATRENTRGARFGNDVNEGVGVEATVKSKKGKLSDEENQRRQKQFSDFMAELSRNGGDIDSAAELSGVPTGVANKFRSAPPEVLDKLLKARITRDPAVAAQQYGKEEDARRQLERDRALAADRQALEEAKARFRMQLAEKQKAAERLPNHDQRVGQLENLAHEARIKGDYEAANYLEQRIRFLVQNKAQSSPAGQAPQVDPNAVGGGVLRTPPAPQPPRLPSQTNAPNTVPGGQPMFARNPQTGQRIMSADGGKTWQPAQ